MNFAAANGLQARVVNCLQTILDLESVLERAGMRDTLRKEFGELKNIMDGIDTLKLQEADVERIERATEGFLHELKTPLAMNGPCGTLARFQ